MFIALLHTANTRTRQAELILLNLINLTSSEIIKLAKKKFAYKIVENEFIGWVLFHRWRRYGRTVGKSLCIEAPKLHQSPEENIRIEVELARENCGRK